MPYKEDGSDVPARIKGKKKRRQWAHVWNSEYSTHGDEGRAFASANSVTSKVEDGDLVKFGTELVGYVGAEFGPFSCATCMYSEELGDESICVNDEVAEDEAVPTDPYSNKLIQAEACCNKWTPEEKEEE